MKIDLSHLAIVILNYCTSDDTLKLVDQLIAFDSNFKIIVVDNHSTDDSCKKLENGLTDKPFVTLIESEQNNGYSAGNNIGFRYAIEHCDADAVCVMNPDVAIPQLSVLENLYHRLFSCQRYGVIGGATLGIDHVYNPNFSGWNIPSNKELVVNLYSGNKRTTKPVNYHMLPDNLASVDCVVGCFFMMKTELLLKMGYLDESFFLYNEENVLGIACKKYGYQEVIALDQFYYHNHDFTRHRTKSLKKRISEAKINLKSRVHLCRLYYPHWLVLPLYAVHLVNVLVVCASCLASKFRRR